MLDRTRRAICSSADIHPPIRRSQKRSVRAESFWCAMVERTLCTFRLPGRKGNRRLEGAHVSLRAMPSVIGDLCVIGDVGGSRDPRR